ncbi:SIS domain-containing protein [Kordia sp. YSTF-M3]|uniref:SIS domain-containing protein n=1 Tax=Kordia aestuariivivens TaxID=2759037 RepID=A0ABR7Q6C3_9FLAO|nr:SIS domain-containing protein [Kordia aestuariivivens]MBC8754083.1 SIS domain-containing protein [Kordia aestuariivivens]
MQYFSDLTNTISKINTASLLSVSDRILNCYNRKGTIYIFGNGGSGATASHVAGDYLKTIKGLRIVCLNDNTTVVSAIANDIHYEEIFREQLKNILLAQDLVIAISGSGNSKNIINAIEYANLVGVETIGFCGFDGGDLKIKASKNIHIPIHDMEITEDLHLSCFHAIKRDIANNLLTNPR